MNVGRLSFAATVMFTFVCAIARAEGPNADWHVVERHAVGQGAGPRRPSPADSSAESPPSGLPEGQTSTPFAVCGEEAHPAQEPYKSIVTTLNQLWGTSAKIYESVARTGPHARHGGCIFYNRAFLQDLTQRWMGISDPDQLEPILYAINAHELGHLVHGDLDRSGQDLPPETRELKADRFAGYTLWRLNIRFDAEDTERYYRLVGDDYVGSYGSHGTSTQRVNAFQEGWDLARMGLPENSSERPIGGLDSGEHPVPPGQIQAP